MATNLDDLSNDEIRIRLQQYGFANLPVTQTTRKVLVKKLKNAMENEKAKNRRETIAVVKSSDDEDIPDPKKRERTPNRRATIAVTEKTKKVPASSSSADSIPELPAPKSTSRRSSRATPAKDPKPVVSSTENVIDEHSDDDVVEVKTYTRRSKTPTMSKSETVRTSYKNQVEIIPEPIPEKKRIVEEIIQPKIPIQSTTTRRKTFTSTATEQFDLPPRNDTPTKLYGKTSLTTSYNPTTNYRFEKEKSQDDDDYEIDESETPYLSNFAKRLSTLKAEPLDASIKTKYTEYRSMNDNYSSVPATSYKYSQYGSSATPSYQPAKRSGVVNQMTNDFNKMDKKYSVQKYVYIALIIMLIIAIYVLLFL